MGALLVLDEPLSFWGGVDRRSGRIIDEHHPQAHASVAGRVLAMPTGRGSSSSSSVLAETIRAGTGPVAVLLREPDVIVLLGAMAAGELYARHCPVVVLPRERWALLRTGQQVEVVAERVSGPATVTVAGNPR